VPFYILNVIAIIVDAVKVAYTVAYTGYLMFLK
jgi:hypothetical protein